MDAVRHGFQQKFKELSSRPPVSLVNELGDGEFASGGDAEQVELAFRSLDLGDINVEEADRVALEALSLCLGALNIWRTGYAVPRQAAVQG
jgi:hypothetical protein